MVFAIKMLLDNTYGLPNLFEFKSYHFNSFYQAESEFKNSNFGGKYIEIMSSLMFSNKYNFRLEYNIFAKYVHCFANIFNKVCTFMTFFKAKLIQYLILIII